MTDANLAFLFADIEGCAQLWDQFPAALPAALQQYDDVLRRAIQQHGGRVFKMMGDACCAVFDAPGAAVAAALTGQRALLGIDWGEPGPLLIRMALHAGPAERRDDDYFGPSLNRVARILAAGHGGQLLLSQAFQQQIGATLPPAASLRDLGERRLRGLAEPERLFQLQAPDLPADFPPLLVPESNPLALPAASALFVGRQAECAAIRRLLLQPDARLVTLVGPGGIGKTRLSQQVAPRLADDFPDGVHAVALAAVSDPQVVPSAVAQALGVKQASGASLEAALFDYLAGRRLLLVLDNLEQLLGAAPFVARLLAAAADVRILATSRELLRLPAERAFPVPPLAMPDPSAPCSPEEAGRFDALRLFIERAQLAKSDWTLPAEQVPALIEICAQLDGLPLAIELAAARVRLLSLPAMLQRLNQRLKLLTGGSRDLPTRQQTLRGAIDWSFDLLAPPEQTVFARMSVFAGGWTLAMAQSVCPEHAPAMEEVLENLANKSLLRCAGTTPPRWSLLATLHEYALERLAASGELEPARARHAQTLLELAAQAEPELHRPQQIAWMDRLETEHDNLRAALAWLHAQSDAEPLLRLTSVAWHLWLNHSHFDEGRRWLGLALDRDPRSSAALRVRLLIGAGVLARMQNDYAQARALFDEGLALVRAGGDKAGIATILRQLGLLELFNGQYETATRLMREGLMVFRRLDDQSGISSMLINLSLIALYQGDDHAVVRYASEGLGLVRQLGDTRLVAVSLWNMALGLSRLGERERALPLLQESLGVFRDLGDINSIGGLLTDLGYIALWREDEAAAVGYLLEGLALSLQVRNLENIAFCLEGLGRVAVLREAGAYAATVFGAAAAIRRRINNPMPPRNRLDYDEALLRLYGQLAPEAFASAWDAGEALGLEPLAAYAAATPWAG